MARLSQIFQINKIERAAEGILVQKNQAEARKNMSNPYCYKLFREQKYTANHCVLMTMEMER